MTHVIGTQIARDPGFPIGVIKRIEIRIAALPEISRIVREFDGIPAGLNLAPEPA